MSTSLAIPINREVSKWDDAEMVRTLRETVCKGATDPQFRMFVEIAKTTGLNPLLKEIWFVPGVGIMAGRDGYLRIANEHPMFDGMETLIERDSQGIPVKATCKVWRKDRSHPITCEAYYNEYKKSSQVWTTYKSAMIGKVAEVLALKRSFSINGVVTEEEIGYQGEHASEPKRGTKAAAQSVAETKIKALAEVAIGHLMEGETKVEHIIDAETEPVTLPAEGVEFKRMMEAFQGIKPQIGEEVYYRILRGHGFEKSNLIRPLTLARRIFKEMLAEKNTQESRKEWAGKLATLEASNSDLFWEVMGVNGFGSIEEVPTDSLGRMCFEIEDALGEGKGIKVFWESREDMVKDFGTQRKRIGDGAFQYALTEHGIMMGSAKPDANTLKCYQAMQKLPDGK